MAKLNCFFMCNDVMHQRQPFLHPFTLRESKLWFFNVHQRDSCWQSPGNIKNRCPSTFLMNKYKPQDFFFLKSHFKVCRPPLWKRTSEAPPVLQDFSSIHFSWPDHTCQSGIHQGELDYGARCCLVMSYHFVRNQLEALFIVNVSPWSAN